MAAYLHRTQISKPDYEFWSKFLEIYKSCEYLWSNKPQLQLDKEKYRVERQEGFLKLVKYCRTRYPKTDVKEIKKHLQNFQINLKKHHNKVLSCRKHGLKFKPLIWYYEMLSFLIKDEEDINQTQQNEIEYKELNNTLENQIEMFEPERKHAKLSTFKAIVSTKKNDSNSINNNDKTFTSENFDTIIKPIIKIEIDETNLFINSDNQEESINKYQKKIYIDEQNNPSTSSDLQNPSNNTTLTVANNSLLSTYLTSNEESNTISEAVLSENSFSNFEQNKEIELKNMKKNNLKTNQVTSKDFYTLSCKTLDSILKLSTPDDSYEITGKKYASDLREIKDKEQRLLVEKIMNEVMYYAKNNLLANTYFFEPNIKNFLKPENEYQQK